MSNVVWRVVRLNRPIVGRSWWLQQGTWITKRQYAAPEPIRKFSVLYEEQHPTREAAETSRSYWAAARGPAQGREGS